MPNVQGKVLGPGRSLTTLLDNRATSEAREDIRRQLRRSLECLVGVHFTEGNAITVLRNGDEIFPAMLEAIRKAQHTVDLMTFVYWKGWPAQQFADARSSHPTRTWSPRSRRLSAGGSTWTSCCPARMRTNALRN